MKAIKYLFLFIILTLITSELYAQPVNRNILAVTDSSERKVEPIGKIHEFAEMPLEYLGFKLDYVDVTGHLPSDQEMEKYGAIISWFIDNDMKGAEQYAEWITRQLKKGKKLLLLGYFGFITDGKKITPDEILNNFYNTFGISVNVDKSTESPLLIEIVKQDKTMTEFERSLKGDMNSFTGLKVTNSGAKVYLKLKRRDSNTTCDAVFTSRKGSMAYADYAAYQNPIDYQKRWRIDPFKFFREALNADFPKPDFTTLNGMRLFSSHIDGDGIRNLSYIDNKSSSGEILYREILTKYKLPINASVLIGDLLVGNTVREKPTELIKQVFRLPNIEPASHGMAHPLIWKEDGRKMAITPKGYNYSPENEIGKTIAYINKHLVPKWKKTNIFFWTGDCAPDYEALRYVYDNNILNINGGDTRFDKEFPSYAYVAPLFRQVDGLRQYYAPDSNEVIFTNVWTGPFYGFRNIIQTYEKTESPIRVKPIDVYYHFYVAEYEVSLETIINAYDWALEQDIAPVFVSDYLKTASGFLTTEIEKIGSGWQISNSNDLRTIRFDNTKLNVDMNRSHGVLGFHHYQNSLYVHLSNGKKSTIFLTPSRPKRHYISKANGKIFNFKENSNKSSFDLKTIGRVQVEIGGLTPHKQYSVSFRENRPVNHFNNFCPWLPIEKLNLKITVKANSMGIAAAKSELPGHGFKLIGITVD